MAVLPSSEHTAGAWVSDDKSRRSTSGPVAFPGLFLSNDVQAVNMGIVDDKDHQTSSDWTLPSVMSCSRFSKKLLDPGLFVGTELIETS